MRLSISQFAKRTMSGNNKKRMQRDARRRGTAMLEMLIVMTVAGVILGMAVTTIHGLLAAEREATRSLRYAASLARLARTFRDDLHRTARAELSAADPLKPAFLTLSPAGGGNVRYELDLHLVKRVETDPAGRTHRDDFYFAPGSRLRFDRPENLGLVRLEIEMPTGSIRPQHGDTADAPPPMRRSVIEAALLRGRGPGTNASDGGATGRGATP